MFIDLVLHSGTLWSMCNKQKTLSIEQIEELTNNTDK